MAIEPEARRSLADTTDRINAALSAGSDSSRSEAQREASLSAWSKYIDMLPSIEDRINFAEAAMTYAARLSPSTCELVRQQAREKLSNLKSLSAAHTRGSNDSRSKKEL
jgi:hypothetical protein